MMKQTQNNVMSMRSKQARTKKNANRLSPRLLSRQKIGSSSTLAKVERQYTETSNEIEIWAFMKPVGSHAEFLNTWRSMMPRKRAANSTTTKNMMRMGWQRHHWIARRWNIMRNCFPKPGRRRSKLALEDRLSFRVSRDFPGGGDGGLLSSPALGDSRASLPESESSSSSSDSESEPSDSMYVDVSIVAREMPPAFTANKYCSNSLRVTWPLTCGSAILLWMAATSIRCTSSWSTRSSGGTPVICVSTFAKAAGSSACVSGP
mmetsp:Transcript_51018/g.148552  ORF Transcript_51018/g.148552 Transcript_51018/m.148552 type:complete len:262 (-) Transcript_51018:538-1323(-)